VICASCGERIGVNERVMVLSETRVRETSLGRTPELRANEGEVFVHPDCALQAVFH
jgi:hypothetical protein